MVLVCTYPRARFDAEMPGTGADLVRELAYEATFALINLALHQIKVPGRRPEGLVGSLVSYANQQADRYLDWGTTHWGIGQAAPGGYPGQPSQPGQSAQNWQAAPGGYPGQPGQPAQNWQSAQNWQQARTGRPAQAWPDALGGSTAEAAGALRTAGAVARTTALGGWRSGFSLANRDSYIVVHACGISLDHLLLTPVTDHSVYGLAADPPLLGDMHWELWPNHQELGYDDLAYLVGAP